MENSKKLITTKGLKKFYYTDEVETTALSNVNLEIKEGEFVTTGTCVEPMPISSGDNVSASFGQLGSISCTLS